MYCNVMSHSPEKDLTKGDFIRFTIPGNPVPLQRARHGKGRTWDPQKEDKSVLRSQFKVYHADHIPFDSPVVLEVVFHMAIPKSISPKRAQLLVGDFHSFKPDLSNLIKFVEDTFNELLYTDDSKIVIITASKVYSTRPRTEVLVRKLCKK